MTIGAMAVGTSVGTFNRARSLYVHVPFCRHRCGYCNFTLVAGRDDLISRYLDALELEINRWTGLIELDTLFLGGGTPSHLSPGQLGRLRQILYDRFEFSANLEFTAECNPNDLQSPVVEALCELGVNRLSLGIQSFQSEKLKFLERTHGRKQALDAIELARQEFHSVSVDLIFGCPDESKEDWGIDLETALECSPNHLSVYELTYEKGTRFWSRLNRGELHQLREETRADLYQQCLQMLTSAGWEHYEISSFCRFGHRCLHNLVYWSGQPFLAAGPGASRFVKGVRETNHRSTTRYLELVEAGKTPVAESEVLEANGLAKDLIVFGLRRLEGVRLNDFEQATGVSLSSFLGELADMLCDQGLLFINHDVCRLTDAGLMVYDSIAIKIYEID